MRRKIYRLSAVVLALVLSLTVAAHDVPELDRLGSISVTTHIGDTIVTGGTLTIYRVGEVAENDGNYAFVPADAFAGCGESFENLDAAADIALRLKDYAAAHAITGLATKPIGDDGTVTFDDLEVGLYLVAQYQAAPGCETMAPFLVSLPYLVNGEYCYELDATPKTELEQTPEPLPPLPDPELPETGQLRWPIPLLASSGLLLILIGMALCRKSRQDNG